MTGGKKTPSLPTPEAELEALWLRSNLTRRQLMFWIAHKRRPHIPLLNAPFLWTIPGPLDAEGFEAAFQAVVDASDSLRTSIEERDGIPRARVADARACRLEHLDLSGDADPTAALATWAQRRATRPFDLTGRLFDSVLIRLSERRHAWFLNAHHLITDTASQALILRHTAEQYARWKRSEPLDVAIPSFKSFVDYERETRAATAEKDVAGRLRRIVDHASSLGLSGPRSDETKSTRLRKIVSPAESAQLREALVADTGLALPALFASLLGAALLRSCGRSELSIGSTVSNRPSRVAAETIGLCLEIVPFRLEVRGEKSLRALYIEAQKALFEALRLLQHAPLNLARRRIYDVLLNVQTANFPPFEGVPVETEWIHPGHQDESLSLNVHDFDGRGEFTLDFHFRDDAFDVGERHRLVEQFQRNLDAFLRSPETVISALSRFDDRERRRVLQDRNDTETDYARDALLHEAFEARVRHGPERTAIVCGQEQVTYRELSDRANALANRLRRNDVGPGEFVGLYGARSIDLIVGMLATLKSGAAYVPIDPGWPVARVQALIRDTNSQAILCSSASVEHVRSAVPDALVLDTAVATAGVEPEQPMPSVSADDLAYVMYTSGSTGIPNGVEVPHRAVNGLVCGAGYVPFGPDYRFLALAPPVFDASTFEIWGALLHGAKLVLWPDRFPDPRALKGLLREHSITHLWLGSGLFNAIIDEAPDALAGVRYLLIGGEALSVSHVRKAFDALAPDTQIVNGYGPTEATTFTCTHTIPNHLAAASTSIAIGRPIANTRVYVLDEHLEPVADGATGELWIAGDGLARGYRNRPELTAARFRRSPHLPDEDRLYRSGDEVRWRPDGELEFVGRLDRQLKIRGHRVEPGEIESRLAEHSAIREALVVGTRAIEGLQLVAYIVPAESDVAPTTETLREFLSLGLPDYLQPTSFVVLDRLPLAASGKVDHAALPSSDFEPVEEGSLAPETPLERMLSEIWCEVLALERVGLRDSFFDLGGDSLRAVRLFAEIERRVGSAPPFDALFRSPTIEGLIAAFARGGEEATLMPLRAHGHLPPLFVIEGLAGYPFLFRGLVQHLKHRPTYSLQLPSRDPDWGPRRQIRETAEHFVEAMLEFGVDGPHHIAGYSVGGAIAQEMACQLHARGLETGLVALLDSYGPLAFERRPIPQWLLAHIRVMRAESWGWSRRVRHFPYLAKRHIHRRRSGVPDERESTAFQAMQRHQTRPYPGVGILIKGLRHDLVQLTRVDAQYGWGPLFAGGLQTTELPFSHADLLSPEALPQLAEALERALSAHEATA